MKNNLQKALLLISFVLCGFNTFAQDIITKMNGEEIMSNVIEVEETKVKYRRFDQNNGPIYTINKTEVERIRYKDGTLDIFNQKAEDTTKAAIVEQEQPMPSPPPGNNTPTVARKAITQSAAPESSSNESYNLPKTYLAYTAGNYSSLGISYGLISNGGGLMFSARFSPNTFGDISIFEMTDAGGIDDDYWNFDYTGNNQYRRGSITAAYISNLYGNTNSTSLHGYVGLGYGYANYYYEYEQLGSTGDSYGYEIIKYVDVSTSGLEAEVGLILDINGFNLNAGYSTCNFAESMLTFGIGLSF